MRSLYMRAPAPPLDAFVDVIWTCERDPESWSLERLLPEGSVELVIDLAAPAGADVVAGPHSRYFVLDTTVRQTLVGIHFRPGGAFPFVRPPLVELRNILAPLDALWGRTARELRDQLGDARSAEERCAIVERVLRVEGRGRLQHHPAVDYALQVFTKAPSIRTVADVSHAVGLSQRRFIQLFSEQVGLTPKVFCRIRRFQRAIRSAHGQRRIDWSALAAECGYFDQAHFIRDFEAFSGLTPSAWAAQRTDHINHVPIRD